MKTNKLARLNSLLRSLGWQLFHDPIDPELRNLQRLSEDLRFHDQADPRRELLVVDQAMQIALRRLIRNHRFDLVIDVGANEGQFASKIRELGYDERIISIEPASSTFVRLCQEHPAGDKQVNIRSLAGRRESIETFPIANGSVFSSLHSPNETGRELFDRWMTAASHETIPMSRLDNILNMQYKDRVDAPRCVMVKTDTQGHDLEVLAGIGDWLEFVAVVLIEYPVRNIYSGAPSGRVIEDYMSAHGFCMAGIYPITKHTHAEELIECDAIFVRTHPIGLQR